MPWSETEICNLAISHLGSGLEITSIDEKSEEARSCKRFFEIVRDSTLRSFAWPFATKIATLGLVEENPSLEWQFSYQYPSDALYARRVLSGFRVDTRDSRLPFKLFHSNTGILLYTDKSDAELEYTLKIEDTARFASDFVTAFSLRLAYYIAPRIVGSNALKVRDSLSSIYKQEMMAAMSFSANEESPDLTVESEFITERG